MASVMKMTELTKEDLEQLYPVFRDLVGLKRKAYESGMLGEASAHELSDEYTAVKSRIEHVRGTVSLQIEKGKGTVFTLRVPLTLAILRSLLFSAADQLFALLNVGAAVLGDGRVVLILDVRALYERAIKRKYREKDYGVEYAR